MRESSENDGKIDSKEKERERGLNNEEKGEEDGRRVRKLQLLFFPFILDLEKTKTACLMRDILHLFCVVLIKEMEFHPWMCVCATQSRQSIRFRVPPFFHTDTHTRHEVRGFSTVGPRFCCQTKIKFPTDKTPAKKATETFWSRGS